MRLFLATEPGYLDFGGRCCWFVVSGREDGRRERKQMMQLSNQPRSEASAPPPGAGGKLGGRGTLSAENVDGRRCGNQTRPGHPPPSRHHSRYRPSSRHHPRVTIDSVTAEDRPHARCCGGRGSPPQNPCRLVFWDFFSRLFMYTSALHSQSNGNVGPALSLLPHNYNTRGGIMYSQLLPHSIRPKSKQEKRKKLF